MIFYRKKFQYKYKVTIVVSNIVNMKYNITICIIYKYFIFRLFFHLSYIEIKLLQGAGSNPAFRTYRVIEEGHVARLMFYCDMQGRECKIQLSIVEESIDAIMSTCCHERKFRDIRLKYIVLFKSLKLLIYINYKIDLKTSYEIMHL